MGKKTRQRKKNVMMWCANKKRSEGFFSVWAKKRDSCIFAVAAWKSERNGSVTECNLVIKINVHNCECETWKSSTAKQCRTEKNAYSSASIRKFRDNAMLCIHTVYKYDFVCSPCKLWTESVRSFTGSYYERLHYGTCSHSQIHKHAHYTGWLALILSFSHRLLNAQKQLDNKVCTCYLDWRSYATRTEQKTKHTHREKERESICIMC